MPENLVAPVHLLVEFDADLENLFEIVLEIVKQLVHVAIADQDHLDVDVDRLGLQRGSAEREEHVDGLNLELAVIERALQRAPDAGFGQRVERVHHQEAAIGAEERPAAQIHEIGIPSAAIVVAAMNRAENVRVGGNRLEDHGTLFLLAMREDHIHAVDAEGIAIGAFRSRRAASLGRRLFVLAFAFLERIEIVENVVADFFEIFGNLRAGIFFLQLFDHAIDQHGSSFLLEIAHFAREFARERERAPVDDGEFLAELIVFAFEFLGGGAFELSFVHHLGDFLDRHHLAVEHRENFGQRDRAHLHAAERKLVARDAAREIVHQFLFAQREALDDARFLALERLAFENLWNAPAQEVDSRLDFLAEGVGLAARQRQQARTVGILEVVHVAAVGRGLRLGMHLLDHAHDHAAAAGAGKAADEEVVAGSGQLDAHAQGAQRAVLPEIVRGGLDVGRRFKRNASGIAAPAQFLRRQPVVIRLRFGVLGHSVDYLPVRGPLL